MPPQVRRQRAFGEMVPETRDLAEEFDRTLRATNRRQVMVRYDLGALVQEILGDAEKFGANGVAQLAEFAHVEGGVAALYASRDVAVAFSRLAVARQSDIPTQGGLLLSFEHFVELAHLPSDEMRTEVLHRIREHDLTISQTRRLIKELAESNNDSPSQRTEGSQV